MTNVMYQIEGMHISINRRLALYEARYAGLPVALRLNIKISLGKTRVALRLNINISLGKTRVP